MRNPAHKNIYRFIAVLALAGVSHLLEHLPSSYLCTLFFCFTLSLYSGLIIFWFISVRERLLPTRARLYTLAAVLLMFFFLMLRTVRYRLASTDQMLRVFWYLYYIPILLIPTLFLMTCLRFSPHDGRKQRFSERWLLLPAFLLILFVLTNDFHYLVFSPTPGYIMNGDGSSYVHYFGYYLLMAYAVFSFACGILVLVLTGRQSRKKGAVLVPMLLFLLLVGMLTLESYLHGIGLISPFNPPEIIIFTLLGIWESAIRYRLIPYNDNYADFFRSMRAPALITDLHFAPAFRTASPLEANEETLHSSLLKKVPLTEDLSLFGKPIRGGYVFWTVDKTAVHEKNRQLSEANEALSEENRLTEAEHKLSREKARVESRNRIYSEIAAEMYPVQKRIRDMLDSADPDSPSFRGTMAEISVLNAYVKRKTNLLLLKEEQPVIPSRELTLCIQESARYLKYRGLTVIADDKLDTAFPADTLILLYDTFEKLAEMLAGKAGRLLVSLTGQHLRLVTDADYGICLPDTPLPVTMEPYGDPEDCLISLTVAYGKGGLS